MPLNISVFNPLALKNGAMQAAPTLSPQVAAQAVALGTGSTLIAGPCLMCLIPDEDQRIGVTTSAYATPSATGIKLKANIERWFELPSGNWVISAVAG